MRQITIGDIHLRVHGLRSINPSNNSRIFIESAQGIVNNKRVKDIKRFIESSIKSNNDIPFYVYTELFDTVIKYGSIAEIRNIGNYIVENAIPKVRDSKMTNSLLKGRLTRLQHKLTSPVIDSIGDAINKLQSNIAPTSTPTTDNSERDTVATEAYNKMIEKCTIIAHCDRVLENYNKVSKRFNLDKLFIENTRINGVGDSVVELCNMIDTYNMPSTIKFNTVIETAWYGFESNSIQYNKSEILEAAVDYFLFKPDGLDSCRQILEATLFYDKNEDMKNIDIFTEEEPEENTENVSESIMKAFSNVEEINNVAESSDFNELFEKFKKEELPKTDKPESKLNTLINKLYRKDVNSIVDETPDLLKWVRRFFIVGTCAVPHIGPVLGVAGMIADKFISIHKDREEMPKMLRCFNNEIKLSKNKLSSTEDTEEKKKLEKYIKSLEDARDKISEYYNKLLTDEEQDKRFENMAEEEGYEYDYDFGDDFDFDDDEFFENSIFGNISRDINSIIEVCESGTINETSMYHLVSHIYDDDLINLAGLVNRYPDIFFNESVVEGIKDSLVDIQKGKITFTSVLEKSVRQSSLNNALSIIESNNEYGNIVTIFEGANELDIINEAYRGLMIMIDTYNNQSHLLEASFVNTLKVASMKLRNAMTKLSDKERSVSRSLDIGMNNFKKSIERALTNDNRESIIKGSILPSFSKIVKMCIINAGLIVFGKDIGLITAVIGTLGYFAINGKFKAKERQMVIDEIEIELEMCEKYINIAEQKNDMKALRQLLTTKKELERQRQRIKYKMRVDFGQKYYDSAAPNT